MNMKEMDLHAALEPQPLSLHVFKEKYAAPGETSILDVQQRVARSLADTPEMESDFLRTQMAGFVPGGRINSAAGMDRVSTLINCFVQPIADCMTGSVNGMPGIMDALAQATETMRRGGGVGYDFSELRPLGAKVKGTDSTASGPVSYMRVFDRACATVESAGSRRGAQMGVLRVDHPDIELFIDAKKTPDFKTLGLDEAEEQTFLRLMRAKSSFGWAVRGAFATLSNFNISVGVTDAFMEAVLKDEEFELVHAAEPGFDAESKICSDGVSRYVYRKVRARDLWERIMRNTYESADPGVLFIDTINARNNLRYIEKIAATNPCVTADAWVQTADGPRQVKDLVGKQFEAIVDGKAYCSTEQGFFVTGEKPVLKLKTQEGYEVRLTAEHKVLKIKRQTRYVRETEWVEACQLKPGDSVVLHNHKALAGWIGEGTEPQGYALGLLLGDGCLNRHLEVGVLSVWPETAQVVNGLLELDQGSEDLMAYAESAVRLMTHRADYNGFAKVVGRDEYRTQSRPLFRLASEFGMTPDNKSITDEIERASSSFYKGFLRGLFDADGCVLGTQSKGVSVRLNQSNLETLTRVQRMLARLGIVSTIYKERRPAQCRSMPDGKGGMKDYFCKANHELVISGENMERFHHLIGFAHTGKMDVLKSALSAYKRGLNRETFVATVVALDDDGVEVVYDATIDEVHAFDANGIYVHNCGEQSLPAYGCCCLGSVNLTRFVVEPFTPNAHFDFEAYQKVVAGGVRLLDKVLDKTKWPLPQQSAEAQNKRRLGLGFLGLGNAMAMLGIGYGTVESAEFASKVSIAQRDAAYLASVDLAKEHGAFPLFSADEYLEEGTFASTLPQHIQDAIRQYGIRNSHLLSIAPTGTISLAFGDNASSGIEPTFDLTAYRNVRTGKGEERQLWKADDHALRVLKMVQGEDADTSVIRTAQDLTVEDHLRVMEAVVPYVDSAISKTVNVPREYGYDDFKDIYMDAWKKGFKGITTYRPNDMIGSVLVSEKDHQAAETAGQGLRTDDPDRRVQIKTVPDIVSTLRWPSRPDVTAEGVTFSVRHPDGDFAVVINHWENGRLHPLEVYIAGNEQPRGLAAIAKALSVDMRSDDGAFLAMKLDSLLNTKADDAFEMTDPATRQRVLMPSLTAGFAALVKHRLGQIGALETGEHSPMVDALFSRREPKTGPNGAIGWHVDIHNPATGDDFLLHTKELVLPNGQIRPYSVWLSGQYPRVLDGLMKVLSIDMRVSDPQWVAMKLRKLLNFGEVRGDFLAQVPGQAKQQNYPSTVAYVAEVLLGRMQTLGLLEGAPLALSGAADETEQGLAPNRLIAGGGKQCPDCHAMTLHKVAGCEVCTACGFTGSCG